MRVVVIGATGRIGSQLVPQLVAAGHDVVAVSRGLSRPYDTGADWSAVSHVTLDREPAEEAGTFGDEIASLGGDVVVDLICYTPASARALVDALSERAPFLVHIGTIWVHGTLTEVPATEDAPRHPWGRYGTDKAEVEQFLIEQSRAGGVPTVVIHPGQICGRGWSVINPQGTGELEVWRTLARGDELLLPGFGLETLHHVHAEDVAQLIARAIEQQHLSVSESFHAVSDGAVTLKGFAEAVASWFGQPAQLRFVPYPEFEAGLKEQYRSPAFEHISRSHSISNRKARQVLGYAPRFTSLAAVADAVGALQQSGQLGSDLPPLTCQSAR